MEHATFTIVDERETEAKVPLTRYEDDAHAWALEQAALLKAGRFADLDLGNLVDEVEDVARRERRDLIDRLSLVYQHLLKWDHQRERRSASWARAIREQRKQVDEMLDENGSLRPHLDALIEVACRQGRVAALNETGLDETDMPETNTLTWDEAMTCPIAWPEP